MMKPLIQLNKDDLFSKKELLQGGRRLDDALLSNLHLSNGVIHNLQEKMELRKDLSAPDLKERLHTAKKLQ